MSKTMTLTDLGQLKRMMAMTTSTNDHEALAFLRRANVILGRHNLTWEDVLSKTVTAGGSLTAGNSNDVENSGEGPPLEEQIQMAFDEIRGNTGNQSFTEFVESIEVQFQRTRYLTPAQRSPLFKAVRQLREKRSRDA